MLDSHAWEPCKLVVLDRLYQRWDRHVVKTLVHVFQLRLLVRQCVYCCDCRVAGVGGGVHPLLRTNGTATTQAPPANPWRDSIPSASTTITKSKVTTIVDLDNYQEVSPCSLLTNRSYTLRAPWHDRSSSRRYQFLSYSDAPSTWRSLHLVLFGWPGGIHFCWDSRVGGSATYSFSLCMD